MRQTCREALFQYKFNDLAWRVRDEKSRREGGRGRKWTIESRSTAYRTVSRTSRRTWLANESLSGRVPRQVHACKIGAVQLYIQSGDIRSKAGNAPRLLTRSSIKSTNSLAIEENAPSFGGYPAYDVISFSRVYIEKSVFHVRKKLKEI